MQSHSQGSSIMQDYFFPRQVTSTPNVSRLFIPVTRWEDAGTISAVAINPAGQATITTRLVVTEPVSVTPEVAPPTFLQPHPPQQTTVRPGEPVTIECQVSRAYS